MTKKVEDDPFFSVPSNSVKTLSRIAGVTTLRDPSKATEGGQKAKMETSICVPARRVSFEIYSLVKHQCRRENDVFWGTLHQDLKI